MEKMKADNLLVEKLDALRKEQGIGLGPRQIDQLLLMDELVLKWNRSLSLIGFATDEERVDRFFIEAVFASIWLPKSGTAIDIGSGGGSPVLPMAVSRPAISWTLLEPNKRKSVYLEEISKELSLQQIEVVRQRYERFSPKAKAQVITTRGVSLGMRGIRRIGPWLDRDGCVMLFTGEEAKERIESELAPPWRIENEVSLSPLRKSRLMMLSPA